MSEQQSQTIEIEVAGNAVDLADVARMFDIDLGADGGNEEFEPLLRALAAAALGEYVLAFSGTRAPATMRELRELRLRLLYEQLEGDLPTDRQVAQLFQLTPTQARTLIAGTRARHRSSLDGRMRKRAVQALGRSKRIDDGTARLVLSESLAAYLRDLIAETQAPPLEPLKDASQTYYLKRSAATAIATRLDVNVDELPGFKKP